MKFITDDQQLTIILEGWEVLWGFRRKLIVPKTAIASLSWQADYKFTGSLFRVGGTGFPGVLYAGYFRANGQRAYLYMKKPRGMSWTAYGTITAPNILEIKTQGFKYPLVLLSCSPEQGSLLTDWARILRI
jgi:hypothetical protein